MTIYDDVNQILLQEDQELQSARKKIKFVTSSQNNFCDPASQTDGSEKSVLQTSAPYTSLNSADVSVYLEKIGNEAQEVQPARESNENFHGTRENHENLPATKVASDSSFDVPRCSSTPVNKKTKRTKTVNLMILLRWRLGVQIWRHHSQLKKQLTR